MSYCTIEDKTAIVSWQWSTGEKESYLSYIVPIDVRLSGGNQIGGIWSMITFDTCTSFAAYSYQSDFDDPPIFINRTINTAKLGLIYSDNSFQCGGIQARDIIFTPSNNVGYTIKISDIAGNILLQQSKPVSIPPTFTVACGKGCSAGQEKIPTIEYPGYKCREKCPPETCCECDCGDVICCYGSNGQVLKTIPK